MNIVLPEKIEDVEIKKLFDKMSKEEKLTIMATNGKFKKGLCGNYSKFDYCCTVQCLGVMRVWDHLALTQIDRVYLRCNLYANSGVLPKKKHFNNYFESRLNNLNLSQLYNEQEARKVKKK